MAESFERITRHYWADVYLQGLLLDGERKSIQPLAQRVNVPGWHGDTMQALQQFITDSTWNEQGCCVCTATKCRGGSPSDRASSSSTTRALPRRAATRWVWRVS